MSALIVNYGINGVKTLTIEHGETKTLKCAGELPMPHGYVVRVTFNTEGYVAYDEVTTVGREGRTRTFDCGSKIMATDIVITAGEYGGDSPLPIGIETEAEMSALLTSATADSVGAVYKYTGETTDTFTSGALYIIAEESE